MIRTEDAIATARSLLGTPYSELDCINLVKRVIRTSPGGVRGYTTAGTNSLWKSAEMSAKYRDLTWRQEGIDGARAGMLALKRNGSDVHHIGLVTGEGTVIHSSSARGKVVETALDDTWQLLAVHRYIEANPSVSYADTSPNEGRQEGKSVSAPLDRGAGTAEAVTEGFAKGENAMDVLFRARVVTKSGALNLRDEPGTGGSRIGSLPRGAVVDVLDTSVNAGWWHVQFGGLDGYACCDYLERIEGTRSAGLTATLDTTGAAAPGPLEEGDGGTDEGTSLEATTLVREDGDGAVTLIGRWRVAQD